MFYLSFCSLHLNYTFYPVIVYDIILQLLKLISTWRQDTGTGVFVICSCVIAELFTEGTIPFDLSQLLSYRSGEYSPSKLFQSIDDVNIRVRYSTLLLVHC